MADDAAQSIQKGLAVMKALIFVGVGAGAKDPNMSGLIRWLRTTFPRPAVYHYLLCRTDEYAHLSTLYQDTAVVPIVYGDKYDDLSKFLEGVRTHISAEGPRARQAALMAADAIASDMKQEAIGRTIEAAVITDAIHNALIPPVLLPVSPEQYVVGQSEEGADKLRRCDSVQESLAAPVTIIVGEESSGVTSALRWLVLERQRSETSLCPVVVDYGHLTSGSRPLERLIKSWLRNAEIPIKGDDALPRLVLAVDNVLPTQAGTFAKRYRGMIADLKNTSIRGCFISCRPGAEADLALNLTDAGLQVTTRYLGRLATRDTKELARLYSPDNADQMSQRAIEIVKKEHLPRTPTTFSFLFSLLLEAEALLSTASETALLDAYVGLLLGKGEAADDSRWSLDALERERILSSVAAVYVRERSGTLSESRVVEAIETRFGLLGWSESATDLLDYLIRRRVLVKSAGTIKFGQSSFLHLFAAKYALVDSQFKAHLENDALYYAPIVRHYAALSRGDISVLRTVAELLAVEVTIKNGSKWFQMAPAADESFDEEGVEAVVTSVSPPPGSPHELVEDDDPAFDDFDVADDTDVNPFPLLPVDQGPPAYQMMTALSLASSVLRDSEFVADLNLKQEILVKILKSWGVLVDMLSDDDAFQKMIGAAIDALLGVMGMPESRRERVRSEFQEVAGFFISYGLMAENLATRKLLVVLQRSFEEADLTEDPGGSVMGALLGIWIDSNWPLYFEKVNTKHGRVNAVTTVLRQVATHEYFTNDELVGETRSAAETFIVEQLAGDYKVESEIQRSQIKSSIRTALSKRALIAKQLVPGDIKDTTK